MLEVIQRLGVYPRSCVMELTLRCNLRCRHCGSYAGTPRPDELSTEEWLRVASQLAELHGERVTLGGGEPTLFRDWPILAQHLARQGGKVNIITNGQTWSPEHSQRARDAGLWNVAFSLDGLEATHDYIRCCTGSYRKVLAGLESCRAQGLSTSVVSHINRKNFAELPAMREVLAQSGVDSWQLQLGTPSGSMGDHPELLIVPRDMLEIVPRLAELKALPGLPLLVVSDNIGYFGKFEKALRNAADHFGFWIGCRAGLQVIGIESNGNVKGCLSLPSALHQRDSFVVGNLRQASLAEIWQRREAFVQTRGFSVTDLGGFCGRCPYSEVCRGGCLWLSYWCSGVPRDNPFCFYRVAVENQAYHLLDEDEVEEARSLAP